jgi:hypothetical protein
MKRAGWVMTVLFALFMLGGSAAPKLLGAQVAADSMAVMGWPLEKLAYIGVIELVGTVLFLIPRSALAGAIVLTALFGGAIASHWRVYSPWFSHTLFGVYLGVFMWLALWLRDDAVRKVLPFPRRSDQK